MPEELFDIYDEQMNPLGTATRSETHAKGYWHRSFHCWLARKEKNRIYVRFQQRHAGKDTFPGYYDITAAGHLAAGETARDAVREIEEELGVAVAFEELLPLGEARMEKTGSAGGVSFIDREVSEVFGYECDVPLSALKLQPEEVAAVYEAELDELLLLFEGKLASVSAKGVALQLENGQPSLVPAAARVSAGRFVPRVSSYYVNVLTGLRSYLLA
ncbi:NUDIX hydrolase [Paenibacillus protaetiae]|uniref:NUDIX domain-containing protein n=1 Tax=Paenibacillus protaetiae TaxID=2509456 RepID=A0A4P6EV49_9BACL|nr:NUDIX domain-containing protein [Paenibacillus protaetiae]QAY67150.1 NUDIX domain-containing protein [Paenibacillus protaetiae]